MALSANSLRNDNARRWNGGARVVSVVCLECGKAFRKYKKQAARAARHYCSKECRLKNRHADRNPKWRGGLRSIACCKCQTRFQVYPGSKRKYCSQRCAWDAKIILPPMRPASVFSAMHAGKQVNVHAHPKGWETKTKEIPGLQGYFITSNGIVVSRFGTVLKTTICSNGYPRVSVILNGRQQRTPIHKLVACTWIGPRPTDAHVVAHNDGNKLNSSKENLRWATHLENYQDSVKHGTASIPPGFLRAKLDATKVLKIRNMRQAGNTYGAISSEIGVCIATVIKAAKRITWRDVA